jgi:hypothetical protein
MKDYIALVATSNNKCDCYEDFDSKADADAHVATHGGFVIDNPGGVVAHWVVNASAKTVTYDKSAHDADNARRTAILNIEALEAEVTQRRIRDAFADPAWMNAQEAKIKTERDKL